LDLPDGKWGGGGGSGEREEERWCAALRGEGNSKDVAAGVGWEWEWGECRVERSEERGAILCISEHKSKMYILYLLIGPVIGDIQASAWYQLSTTGSKRSSIDYALI
jgi:hypothetical protein